jgi:hypothetical protein
LHSAIACRGLIHDVEIYRCRRTVAEAPRYQAYLGQINALRDRHPDLLVRGTYRDTAGFTIDNDDIDARCFTAGDQIAMVLSQSHLPEAATKLTVPGYRFAEADGVGQFSVSADGVRVTLGRHGVAVIVCQRQAP